LYSQWLRRSTIRRPGRNCAAVRGTTWFSPYSSNIRADRTYQWGGRRLTLIGEVINVLNRENLRQVPPGIDRRTGRAFEPLDVMFPIVPSVGVTLEF
jgi:hypothetical protein